jgi:hypothetical protein
MCLPAATTRRRCTTSSRLAASTWGWSTSPAVWGPTPRSASSWTKSAASGTKQTSFCFFSFLLSFGWRLRFSVYLVDALVLCVAPAMRAAFESKEEEDTKHTAHVGGCCINHRFCLDVLFLLLSHTLLPYLCPPPTLYLFISFSLLFVFFPPFAFLFFIYFQSVRAWRA